MKLNWDFEEAIALVDIYYKVKLLDANEDKEIEELSNYLIKRACVLQIEHDETYRNPTGIRMKLKNIEYLDTNGQSGLSSYSNADKKALELYNELPDTYNLILKEFKCRYNK